MRLYIGVHLENRAHPRDRKTLKKLISYSDDTDSYPAGDGESNETLSACDGCQVC